MSADTIKRKIYVLFISINALICMMILLPLCTYAMTRDEIQSQMIATLYGNNGGRVSCDFDGYTTTSGRHEGIDFTNYEGAPVYSLINGTVIRAVNSTASSSLSTIAIYDSEHNKTVIYLHSNVEVSAGQNVSQGQRIANEGRRGAGSSPHTHVEVRNGQQQYASVSVGDPVLNNDNPYPYWEEIFSGPSDTERPVVTNVWFEQDPANNYMAIHADGTDNVGIVKYKVAVWSDVGGQDDLKWLEGGAVGNHVDVGTNFPSETDGTWRIDVYAVDGAGNESLCMSRDFSVDYWSTPPTVTDAKIVESDAAGYTVQCKVTDANGVAVVKCPTWTENNGQDDLVAGWQTKDNDYYQATDKGNSIYEYRIDDSSHNCEKGKYNTHIYAMDNRGNWTSGTPLSTTLSNNNQVVSTTTVGNNEYSLIDDASTWDEAKARCEEMGGHLAVITSVTEQNAINSLIKNGKRSYYWIGLTDEAKEGTFKWITGENFKYTNWRTSTDEPNNGNGSGEDYVHVCSDGLWNDNTAGTLMGFICENTKKPVVSDVKVTDVDETGYTISCKVTSDIGIDRVQFPSWTPQKANSDGNVQDDIQPNWQINSAATGTRNGDIWTYRVSTSAHNGESGVYRTHIYAYDTSNNITCYGETPDVTVPAISNVPAKTVTYNGNQYERVDANCTWEEARARCNAMGGHLVSIRSSGEQDAVAGLISGGARGLYWTGLTDKKNGGDYQWVSGEQFKLNDSGYYSNWKSGEPNNNENNEYFIEISTETGKWNDNSGTTTGGFICEIEDEAKPSQEITYNGHDYMLFEEGMSWTDAEAKCQAMGGHLASITSSGEQSALANLVNKGYGGSYYIGGNRGDDGTFKWSDGEAWTYKDGWSAGQPDNSNNNQNYTRVSAATGQWDDINEGYAYGFICEINHQDTVISDAKVTEKDGSGYTVSCKVSPSSAIERVWFPTWTTKADGSGNAQDDIIWGLGTKNGDTWTYRVNVSDHSNETGIYRTHIYAYSHADKDTGVCYGELGDINVANQATPKASVTYNGNQYLLIEDSLSWSDARAACNSMGGHLVTITSQGEQDAVAALKMKGNRNSYWIGLSGKKDTGFKWVDGEQINYNAWDNGQPDNWNNVEDAGIMWNTGAWNDMASGSLLGYICEIESTMIPSAAASYNGHDYQLFDEQMTWADAKAKCEAMGGHLVTITSQGEQDVVAALKQKGYQGSYWIGLSGTKATGFSWVNGETFNFTSPWDSGQPDNCNNSEDAVVVWNSGAWNDASSKLAFGFICEKDSQAPSITDVKVTDVSSAGYTVTCSINAGSASINRVQFPTWTPFKADASGNGQDDIQSAWDTNSKASGNKNGDVYSYRINVSDHNNESGVYRTHIYAFDAAGNSVCYQVPDITLANNNEVVAQTTYNGNTYKLIEDSLTWNEAREKCLAMGGHLVTITNADEQTAVAALAHKGNRAGYWIGLSDAKTVGVYRWVTDEIYRYNHWCPGEPNNTGGKEHYVELSSVNGLWNDNSDSAIDGYICEIEQTERPAATYKTITGTQYILVDGQYTWEQAKAKAAAMGGHLATITSQNEQGIVANLVKKGFEGYYYLGAIRADASSFKWDDGETWTYGNASDGVWAGLQPDNYGGNQNYVRMSAETGKWDDINAGYSYGFVCEIDDLISVTGITLDKAQDVLTIGGTDTLKATIVPDNATDKTVKWSSANAAVATVDASGKITAVAKGATVITATTSNGKQATCTVTVKEKEVAVTGITLDKTESVLTVGGTDTVKATIVPDNATDKTVKWSSANAAVATVDASGKITAVAKGATTITATTSNGQRATCTVTVNEVEDASALKIEGVCGPSKVKPGGTTTITVSLKNYDISEKDIASMQIEVPSSTNQLTYVADSQTSIIENGEFSDALDGNKVFTFLPFSEGENLLPKTATGLFSFQVKVSDTIAQDTDVQLPIKVTIGDKDDHPIMENVTVNIVVPVRMKVIKKGDLNNSGSVDIMDARKAKRGAMKNIVLTSDEFEAADLDGNGEVSIIEARKIKRAAMKIITLE